MARTDKPDIRFIIYVTRAQNSDFLHVEARPVIRRPEYTSTDWDSHFYTYQGEPYLDCFRVEAQADLDDSENRGWYAMQAAYHPWSGVTLQEAEREIKILRKVGKGMEKFYHEFGEPLTIGAYIARVAKILGITKFGFRHPDGGLWASGEEFNWGDASTIDYQIRSRVEKIREKVMV
jgi:hypothetical protein